MSAKTLVAREARTDTTPRPSHGPFCPSATNTSGLDTGTAFLTLSPRLYLLCSVLPDALTESLTRSRHHSLHGEASNTHSRRLLVCDNTEFDIGRFELFSFSLFWIPRLDSNIYGNEPCRFLYTSSLLSILLSFFFLLVLF